MEREGRIGAALNEGEDHYISKSKWSFFRITSDYEHHFHSIMKEFYSRVDL